MRRIQKRHSQFKRKNNFKFFGQLMNLVQITQINKNQLRRRSLIWIASK